MVDTEFTKSIVSLCRREQLWTKRLILLTGCRDGAGMAQWWEHSPPTNVARVRFPDSASYVGWVCWFSTLLREVFSGYSGFPSPQKPTFDLIYFHSFQFTVSSIRTTRHINKVPGAPNGNIVRSNFKIALLNVFTIKTVDIEIFLTPKIFSSVRIS